MKNMAEPMFSHHQISSQSEDVEGNSKWLQIQAVMHSETFRTWRNLSIMLLYFIVGCIFYFYEEGWGVGTTIQFTIVTFTTVGFGYIYPTTDRSRLFTIFYMIFGVYFVFFAIQGAIAGRFAVIAQYLKNRVTADQMDSTYRQYRYMLVCNVSSIIFVLVFGGLIFMTLEDWTFIEALYFAVETSTTVGYGDIPISSAYNTRVFLGFYIIFSTILMAFAFNNFVLLREQQKLIIEQQKILLKRRDLGFLKELDINGQGVTESQFILAVLEYLRNVDTDKDIKPWKEKFYSMNPDANGRVYYRAINEFTYRESEMATQEIQQFQERFGSTIDDPAFHQPLRTTSSSIMSSSSPSMLNRPSVVSSAIPRPSNIDHQI